MDKYLTDHGQIHQNRNDHYNGSDFEDNKASIQLYNHTTLSSMRGDGSSGLLDSLHLSIHQR